MQRMTLKFSVHCMLYNRMFSLTTNPTIWTDKPTSIGKPEIAKKTPFRRLRYRTVGKLLLTTLADCNLLTHNVISN